MKPIKFTFWLVIISISGFAQKPFNCDNWDYYNRDTALIFKVEYIYDSTHTFQCVDTDDISINMLNVLFSRNANSKTVKADRIIAERLSESRHKVVFDQQFQCGHLHHDQKPFVLTPPLNHQWWSLAEADYKSELASSCGCAHDHH